MLPRADETFPLLVCKWSKQDPVLVAPNLYPVRSKVSTREQEERKYEVFPSRFCPHKMVDFDFSLVGTVFDSTRGKFKQ